MRNPAAKGLMKRATAWERPRRRPTRRDGVALGLALLVPTAAIAAGIATHRTDTRGIRPPPGSVARPERSEPEIP